MQKDVVRMSTSRRSRVVLWGIGMVGMLVLGNFLVYGFLAFTPWGEEVGKQGYVVRIGDAAWIFAHGKYFTIYDPVADEYARMHLTNWKGGERLTESLVRELQAQGVQKIWLSQCEAGDAVQSVYNEWGEGVVWGENVNRGKGVSVPFFYGLGFAHLPLPKWVQGLGI